MSDMTKESVDFVETVNLFNVSMGKGLEGLNQYYEKAIKFQNTLHEKLGTNIEESMNYQALFNSMSKSMGISAKYAYTLSENFTKLGYDLASLYNIDPTNAMQKLRAGLAGQTKPLRDLGLDITQQSLQPIVEQLGIKNAKGETISVKNMSQAEKAVLRYIAVLKQAQIAQGDFANTMESPANQLRIFNAQVIAFKRNMGNLWQGFLGGILPYINAIMMVINELLKMIAKLFGFKVSEQNVNISANIGADDLADDLGTASKKAKELKAQLMGFDEINNISLQKDSGSGSGGTSAGGIDQRLLDAMKEYDNLMDKVKNKSAKIAEDILKWLGFTRDSNGELKWSWKNMDGIAKSIIIIVGLITGIKILSKLITLVGWTKTLHGVFVGAIKPVTNFQRGLQTIGGLFSKTTGAINKSTGALGKHAQATKTASSTASGFASKTVSVISGLVGIAAGSALSYKGMNDLTTGTTSTGKAVAELAGGLGIATASGVLAGSQFGIVGMAIGGVVGFTTSAITAFMGYKDGIESLNIPATKLTGEIKNLTEELNNNRKAHENNVKSIKDTYENQLLEAEYAQKLSTQLEGLVDSNGKVKEGNEERVNFILGELSNALNEEYALNGNIITKNGEVVNSYKDLQKGISDIIEAKKKEAKQTAITEMYKESIKEQIKLERDKIKVKEEFAKAEKEYNDLMAKGLSEWTLNHDESCKQILQNYTDMSHKYSETVDKWIDSTNDVQYYSQQMTEDVIQSTGKLTSEMVAKGETTADALKKIALNNVQNWEETYNKLNETQKTAMLAQSTSLDTWSPIIEQKWKEMAQHSSSEFLNGISQVDTKTQDKILSAVTTTENMTPNLVNAWKNLAQNSYTDYNNALSKVDEATQIVLGTLTNTTGKLTPEQIEKWANLAKNNKSAYENNLSGLDITTSQRIQSCVDAINNKKWTAEETAKGLASAVERGVNTIDTTEAGRQAVNGVAQGINQNKNSWNFLSAISGLASNLVTKLKEKLGIHSPSRVMRDMIGKFIPLGIAEGIDKESKSVYSSIQKLNKGIMVNSQDFTINTNQFIDYGKINGSITTQSKVAIQNDFPQQIKQAVIEGMKNIRIPIEIEAKTDEGVIFKSVQVKAAEFAMQTGESPFPVII